jgi:hypothetical protein
MTERRRHLRVTDWQLAVPRLAAEPPFAQRSQLGHDVRLSCAGPQLRASGRSASKQNLCKRLPQHYARTAEASTLRGIPGRWYGR